MSVFLVKFQVFFEHFQEVQGGVVKDTERPCNDTNEFSAFMFKLATYYQVFSFLLPLLYIDPKICRKAKC